MSPKAQVGGFLESSNLTLARQFKLSARPHGAAVIVNSSYRSRSLNAHYVVLPRVSPLVHAAMHRA